MRELISVKRRYVLDMLDAIILRYLESENLHLYGILKKVKMEYGVLLSPSDLQYSFARLLRRGAIEKGSWCLSSTRPCIPYTITEKGRELLKDQVKEMRLLIVPFIDHPTQTL